MKHSKSKEGKPNGKSSCLKLNRPMLESLLCHFPVHPFVEGHSLGFQELIPADCSFILGSVSGLMLLKGPGCVPWPGQQSTAPSQAYDGSRDLLGTCTGCGCHPPELQLSTGLPVVCTESMCRSLQEGGALRGRCLWGKGWSFFFSVLLRNN